MACDLVVDKSPMGKKRISGMTFFMVFTPNEKPVYRSMKRKCKDAVMAFEDAYDIDWEEAVKQGFSVFKCWANGIEANEKVKHMEEWTEEDPWVPEFYKQLSTAK